MEKLILENSYVYKKALQEMQFNNIHNNTCINDLKNFVNKQKNNIFKVK
jgi:hypothetical protein